MDRAGHDERRSGIRPFLAISAPRRPWRSGAGSGQDQDPLRQISSSFAAVHMLLTVSPRESRPRTA
ncbi:MAG: hypothetical protein LBE67_05115 [Kocuria palustris]|nr:hypothetical protein [Kocuria palustris]